MAPQASAPDDPVAQAIRRERAGLALENRGPAGARVAVIAGRYWAGRHVKCAKGRPSPHRKLKDLRPASPPGAD